MIWKIENKTLVLYSASQYITIYCYAVYVPVSLTLKFNVSPWTNPGRIHVAVIFLLKAANSALTCGTAQLATLSALVFHTPLILLR